MLQAAKEIARREKTTAGNVISELARKGLTARSGPQGEKGGRRLFGFEPFPTRGGVVTNELIDRLREEDPG